MELSQSELEQLEVDKLFKQLAIFNCNYGWLLYDISKTKYRFNKQNYLNIAYGLNQSTIARYKSPTDYADIMDLFNRNLFRNIIFEYLDIYFGEYPRKFKNIVVIPESWEYIHITVQDEESKNDIEKALKEIIPDYVDYISIEIVKHNEYN